MKLPPSWKLPASITNRFGPNTAGKQRAMTADDHLLLVLHRVPQPGARDRQPVFFWRKPNGSWEHSSGGIGIDTLIKHLQEYNTAVDQFEQDYAKATDVEDYFRLLEVIFPVRLAAQNLHATLQAAREAVPHDRDLISLRDWAYDIERTLNLIYENTKNAMDFSIAKQAEEQNKIGMKSVEASHRLNILAAIFYPLTAISCVFGMNLANGLETSHYSLFWFVLIFTLLLGVFVRRWVTRGKWL
ncbi:hypothetical protein OOK60_05535 [Trichothermofontia sichuanensis B231]|uniref:CorA family divalent cation transporter n=1 Tax=Trichothermofontia sichuanensis TaxID=3045816 RepID=UPI00224664DD|nr:CorA family divalent cation transporter [Trichothermofontia sichuanensis]UZQ55536.1 hypothetical protein OOK60_05535 [Trichothermofontia sichuanensis B231]